VCRGKFLIGRKACSCVVILRMTGYALKDFFLRFRGLSTVQKFRYRDCFRENWSFFWKISEKNCFEFRANKCYDVNVRGQILSVIPWCSKSGCLIELCERTFRASTTWWKKFWKTWNTNFEKKKNCDISSVIIRLNVLHFYSPSPKFSYNLEKCYQLSTKWVQLSTKWVWIAKIIFSLICDNLQIYQKCQDYLFCFLMMAVRKMDQDSF